MRRGSIPLLMLMCFAPSVSADDLPVERSLAIQMHASHAELLLIYIEPAGPRTERILALYDSNKNGNVDGTEAVLARAPMLRRARIGLDVMFTGALTAEKETNVRFTRDKTGGIAMATYQRIDFVAKKDVLSVDVTLSQGNRTTPLQVVVKSGADWELEGDEPTKSGLLTPGTSMRFPMKRYAAPVQTDHSTRDWKPPDAARIE